MPSDPRNDPKVTALAKELQDLEYVDLKKRIRRVKDDDTLGWVSYHFMGPRGMERAWQLIVINRWLERDKFFRNVLPQWIGTAFGILSFAVSVLALVVALTASKP